MTNRSDRADLLWDDCQRFTGSKYFLNVGYVLFGHIDQEVVPINATTRHVALITLVCSP